MVHWKDCSLEKTLKKLFYRKKAIVQKKGFMVSKYSLAIFVVIGDDLLEVANTCFFQHMLRGKKAIVISLASERPGNSHISAIWKSKSEEFYKKVFTKVDSRKIGIYSSLIG